MFFYLFFRSYSSSESKMKKRRTHSSSLHDDDKTKRSKTCEENGIILPDASEPFRVEHCKVHFRTGFSVAVIAYNRATGRICVIRRADQPNGSERNGLSAALSVVEFYNAEKPPLIFLEKVIPVLDCFESVIWIGGWAIFGGLGGRATFLSPYTSKFGRIQLCSSDILVTARTTECQFVLGNSSAELLVLNKRKVLDNEGEEGIKNGKVPSFTIIQTIKLPSEERITAIACSKALKPQIIAVGKVNGLSLFISERNLLRKHKEIAIPSAKKNANIIWSLVFVDNFLFAGDARGQVCIYNAEAGTLLKTMKTHQAPVLALATDGREVFASGTDFRIQIITSISHDQVRFDWQQCSQRLFHSSDVRSLCVLDKKWLVSGGAEHELFVSDKFHYSNALIKPECSYSNGSSEHKLIVSRNLCHLDLWCKSADESNRAGLRRLLRTSSGNLGFIKQACISPNGHFLAFAGAVKGAIRVLKLNCAHITELNPENGKNGKFVELYWSNQENSGNGSRAVSAMFCTDKFLYIARGEFSLFRLDLHTKQLQTLAINSSYGHIVKMSVDQQDSNLLALTTNQPLYFDLRNVSTENCALSPSPLGPISQYVPFECLFFGPNLCVFLCADLSNHLICYDLRKGEIVGSLSSEQMNLASSNEWISYICANDNGHLIATSNKGRIRMFLREEGGMLVFVDEHSANKKSEDNGLTRSIDSRIEPFWVENARKEPSLLLVGHIDEGPPRQKPYHLKFFGKN